MENKIGNKRSAKRGKERIEEIVSRLLNCKTYLMLVYHFTRPYFHCLRKYVMLFQKEKIIILKVYSAQIDVVQMFLTYFVKTEKLVGVTSGRKIKGVTKSDLLPKKNVVLWYRSKENNFITWWKKQYSFILLFEG